MSQDTRYLYNYYYFRKAGRRHQNKGRRLDALMGIIKSYSPKSVLDVGCGIGNLVLRMRDEGMVAYGTDFAPDLRTYWGDTPYMQVADAKSQPFPDKFFDLVISTDVMEHIPEEDIPAVAEEMKRVGNKVVALVAVEKKLNARQLLFHVTNKPLEWWVEHLPGIDVINSREYEK